MSTAFGAVGVLRFLVQRFRLSAAFGAVGFLAEARAAVSFFPPRLAPPVLIPDELTSARRPNWGRRLMGRARG